jgi:hypothetical protein
VLTQDTYALFPGPNDGTSTAFGVGDLWALQYHPNEFDDGVNPPPPALLNNFLTGEAVKDKDVVVWYGAHFRHDHTNMPPVTLPQFSGTIRVNLYDISIEC